MVNNIIKRGRKRVEQHVCKVVPEEFTKKKCKNFSSSLSYYVHDISRQLFNNTDMNIQTASF